MKIWEIIIIVIMLGIIFGLFYLIYKYTTNSQKKTILALQKQGLSQQQLPFIEAISKFFVKTFDYKSRASMSEYWWPVLFLRLPIYIISLIDFNIWCFLWLLLFLPHLSLYVRRLKDVNIHPAIAIFIFIFLPIAQTIGNANFHGAWVLWVALLGMIAMGVSAWAVFRASDPYKNRFGEIPNVKKSNSIKQTIKVKTDFISKIYFNVFKNIGNIRLLFIISCLFGGISLLTELNSYNFYIWNLLWVVFWFYLPFIIVLPIRFIIDGYKKENKKDKK